MPRIKERLGKISLSKKQNYKRGTNESLKNKNYKGWRLMRIVNELKNISFVRKKSMHQIGSSKEWLRMHGL